MKTLRTFIAIELTGKVQAELAQIQSRLKTLVPENIVRWTAPKNIHLTLHFLGDVTGEDVEKIGELLQMTTAELQGFELTFGNIGCFPNFRRPRVVWIGIQGDRGSLLTLHRELGKRLALAIQFDPEPRPYSPHLTIGRVKRGKSQPQLAQVGQLLEQSQSKHELVSMNIMEIALIHSDLRPTGSIYTPLKRGQLRGDLS